MITLKVKTCKVVLYNFNNSDVALGDLCNINVDFIRVEKWNIGGKGGLLLHILKICSLKFCMPH